jgi:hypothetical protein
LSVKNGDFVLAFIVSKYTAELAEEAREKMKEKEEIGKEDK